MGRGDTRKPSMELKEAKILRCPVCKHELTRKLFNEAGYSMVAYVCDVMGMYRCRFALGYLKGGKK